MSCWTCGAAVFAAGAFVGWIACAWSRRRRERLRARFLSFVAHEINTPITALNMTVLNFVQGTFGPITKEHQPWMRMIHWEVMRLTSLVGDLRDLVHLDFHRDLTLHLEPLSLSELVDERCASMRSAMEHSGIELQVDLEKGLPEVSGDPDRLKRIMTGLLEHARKFRTKGAVKVRCGCDQERNVRTTIEFGGEPMPAQEAAQALDLYYPVHNPTAQVLSGVGIGLGLPNALIGLHGGKMSFTVDEEGLTRVEFRIPISEGGT
ncbi:MAG: HAMP domain-containing sensor histidine kinase [Elusimicrobiota bacterium]